MVFCSPWATLLYCSTVVCNAEVFCYVSFKFETKNKKQTGGHRGYVPSVIANFYATCPITNCRVALFCL